jgi:predicted transposase/invertase (TIGR01784 family)
MNPKKNKQPHDVFFKKAISNMQVAKEFFDVYLPEDIKNKVDLNTLSQQKETFLDHDLGEGSVDVLFSVQFNKEKGYFYVLVEQQTQVNHWMPFRLGKYMMRICDHHLKTHPQEKHLPLIYPLIFYTGTKKYNAPLDLWSLYHDPDLAKSFWVNPFQVIELQTIEDEKLRQHLWSGVMSYIMKRIYSKDIFPFLQQIKPLLEEISKQNFSYIESILWYTLEKAESDKSEQILELFKESVSEEERGNLMPIIDKLVEKQKITWLAEGEARGEARGEVKKGIEIAKRMLSKNKSIEEIIEMTGLSEKELKKLLN